MNGSAERSDSQINRYSEVLACKTSVMLRCGATEVISSPLQTSDIEVMDLAMSNLQSNDRYLAIKDTTRRTFFVVSLSTFKGRRRSPNNYLLELAEVHAQ